MLKHRFIFGGIFLCLFLGIEAWEIASGGRIFTSLLLAAVALAALHDYFDMMHRGGRCAAPRSGMAAAAVLFFLKAGLFGVRTGLEEALVLGGLLLVLPFVDSRADAARRFETAAVTVFGFVYVAVLGSFFLDLVAHPGPPEGVRVFLWTVVVVKSGDSGSYFVGGWIGRRALSSLSPKKTWEGAIGGLVVGGLFAAALALLLLDVEPIRLPLWVAAGVVLQGVGQVGDLVESAVKRGVGVKDSGTWLPGIGGILDTVDSLLPAAPLAVLVQRLLAG